MKRIGLFLLALTLFVGVNTANAGINVDSLKSEIIKNSKEIQEQKKDSVMYSKLSADQILELKKGENEVRRQEIENEGRSDMPLNGAGIVLICLLPFLFAAVIITLNVRAKNEESKRRYDLYTKSIEMGQTIPDHFFDEPKKADNVSNFKRGILWLAVGVAVVISFLVMGENKGLFIGIVPTFVGIGYLLVHYLDKPKTDSTPNNEQHG
ncbi:MAG: DUF6249 domain-containing protein [Paludibacter sp.]|jgi:hypothetical protein|nr:DUF6249 domain-containing protein [Paludibacter sp.]